MKFVINYILFAIAMASTIYYNGLNDPLAKNVSMVTLGLLFIIAFFISIKRGNHPKEFRHWFLWIVLAFVINLLYGMEKYGYDKLFNISIAMPLMAAFASYYLLDIKREKLSYYLLPICAFSAYCAVSSVLHNIGSLHVSMYYDDDVAKNQIGAAYALMAVICVVFAIENKKFLIKILYAIFSVLCIYPALFFACRTALLSYFVVVIILLISNFDEKSILPILLLLWLIFLNGNELNNLLYDSIVGNRDINDADDLTSGRLMQVKLALNYFLHHPILGYFGSGENAGTMPPAAHIYLLFRLTMWGIVGAIPAIALYFSVFKVFLRSLKKRDFLIAGSFALAFIESFSEFSAPFGPGSCFIVGFILLGYYMRQESNNDIQDIRK